MGRLDGKVAVITGSGRGIGRAAAILFAKEGCKVVVNDIDNDVCDAVVKEIKDAGGDAVGAGGLSVANREDAQKIIDTAINTWGKINVLINNAGILRDRTLHKMSQKEWQDVIDVCLTGTFNCTQAAYQYMREQQSGHIINVSSVVGTRGNIGQTNYSAAKAGIIGFTYACAQEFARFRIKVNVICPAAQTRLTDSVRPEVLERMVERSKRTPFGKRAQPEDVAPTLLWLASDESDFIAGNLIFVDGGSHIMR